MIQLKLKTLLCDQIIEQDRVEYKMGWNPSDTLHTIGDFLKEIDLSEKKSTGITKILRALKTNGSPLPEFKTDEGRNYLITTFKIHEAFETNDAENSRKNVADNNISVSRIYGDPNDPNHDPNDPETVTSKIIKLVENDSKISYTMLAESIGVSNATIKREIKKLKDIGIIKRIGSTRGHWEVQ
jgi:ATP-dependent DNA helicase RecG